MTPTTNMIIGYIAIFAIMGTWAIFEKTGIDDKILKFAKKEISNMCISIEFWIIKIGLK